MGALTLMSDNFKRFQGQVWARFDTLAEQIATVDHKVSIGATFDEPQAYLSQSSEATQSPFIHSHFHCICIFINVPAYIVIKPLVCLFLIMTKGEKKMHELMWF